MLVPLAPTATTGAVVGVALIVPLGVVLAANLTLGYWTYLDASARGSESPGESAGWVVATLGLGVVAYLYRRRQRLGGRSVRADGREQIVGTCCVASLVALVAPAFGPPDAITSAVAAALAVPPGLVLGYLLVVRGGFDRLRRLAGAAADRLG